MCRPSTVVAAVLLTAVGARAQEPIWDNAPTKIDALLALDVPGGAAESLAVSLPKYLSERSVAAVGPAWNLKRRSSLARSANSYLSNSRRPTTNCRTTSPRTVTSCCCCRSAALSTLTNSLAASTTDSSSGGAPSSRASVDSGKRSQSNFLKSPGRSSRRSLDLKSTRKTRTASCSGRVAERFRWPAATWPGPGQGMYSCRCCVAPPAAASS